MHSSSFTISSTSKFTCVRSAGIRNYAKKKKNVGLVERHTKNGKEQATVKTAMPRAAVKSNCLMTKVRRLGALP
jgi:hypothetical protein